VEDEELIDFVRRKFEGLIVVRRGKEEILLEREEHDFDGDRHPEVIVERCIDVERFVKMCGEKIAEHLTTKKPLSQCLMECGGIIAKFAKKWKEEGLID